MATIGQALTTPEMGYQRINETNSNISYIGSFASSSDSNAYNGSYKYTASVGNKIQFNFIGSKIRIISGVYTNRSNNITIKIDGVNYSFSEYLSYAQYQTLVYEKTSLANIEHYVEIISNDTQMTELDAIDIDSTGIIKPYNIHPLKYLIKQNGIYYTIKSTNYDSTITHNFTSINLAGGSTPNKTDIDTFGFTDLSVLINNMTVGSDTFKPIDKLGSNFDIKMYKIN